jgi:hypothetical protein
VNGNSNSQEEIHFMTRTEHNLTYGGEWIEFRDSPDSARFPRTFVESPPEFSKVPLENLSKPENSQRQYYYGSSCEMCEESQAGT